MPQRRTAIKDRRKNISKKLHNLDIKTDLRKNIKKYLSLVESKNVAEAEAQLKLLHKKIDKAAKRNLLHQNTASHRKSRFTLLLNGLKSKAK